MSGIKCPDCSEIRKIEIIGTPEGWDNPPCWHCGDSGWVQPYDNEDPLSGRKVEDDI